MISYEEACTFLENILELPKTWKKTFDDDKLGFLRLYMRHHVTRIPFQNVTLAAVEVEKRRRPSESDIISQGLTGIGGCCINLNYFTKILFVALGLDAFAIQGSHFMAPAPGTHCMVIVKLNNGNELYMVEVGAGFPFLEPIPMHNLPFRFPAGGFINEFREISEGVIGRVQIGGGLFGGPYVGKAESLRTSWDLVPRKFSEFDYPMDGVFTDPSVSGMLKSNLMYRHFFPEEFSQLFPQLANTNGHTQEDADNKSSSWEPAPTDFVFIFKRRIIIGDAFSRKLVKNYDNYMDMAVDIKTYFPKLKLEDIKKVMGIFMQYEIVPSPYDTIL